MRSQAEELTNSVVDVFAHHISQGMLTEAKEEAVRLEKERETKRQTLSESR